LSELALGWATYNGDHMSMYAVNVSIPKTLVRYLVQYYADTCEKDVLSKTLYDVLDTPVSPELLPPTKGEISQKNRRFGGTIRTA
jgi:NAD synthase